MNIKDAEVLAKSLLVQTIEKGWIDSEWSFEWTRSRKLFGFCDYDQRKIFLSSFLVRYMKHTDVKETILHEIAHAMCEWGEGHGEKWKDAGKRLGMSDFSEDGDVPPGAHENMYRYVVKYFNTPIRWYINRPSKRIMESKYPSDKNYRLVKISPKEEKAA